MGGKRGRHVACKSIGPDFTLNDFANTTSKSGRMQKGKGYEWTAKAKDLTKDLVKTTEDLAWYEKDLSDFDAVGDCPIVQADPVISGSTRKRHRRRKKNSNGEEEEDEEDDTDGFERYPLDLWFVLGSYVDVEEIPTFALICWGSYQVVRTAKFWMDLYKTHCIKNSVLPISLQPGSAHGMRSRVVRALYHKHPLLQQRVRNLAPFHSDPDSLTGSLCLLMWYRRQSPPPLWHFYFKLQRPGMKLQQSHRHRNLLADNDVYDNADENCSVLECITPHFISLPSDAMGQPLVKASLSVSHNMRHHKLRLVFGASEHNNGTVLLLDPVINMLVLHWWHPKYPRA